MSHRIYIVAATDKHGVDRWPVAWSDSKEGATAFIAAQPPRKDGVEFYVDGPIRHVTDPDAAKVAAGLVVAYPGDGYKGSLEDWFADLKARGLWDGRNPSSLDDLWLSEDDHREVMNDAFTRWRDREASYPRIPNADQTRKP